MLTLHLQVQTNRLNKFGEFYAAAQSLQAPPPTLNNDSKGSTGHSILSQMLWASANVVHEQCD